MNKTRLEAFSDGVIAIIITIMVLEIKIPHGGTWLTLVSMWPEFLCYLLSFIYIGIYWGNHHHLLHTVNKVHSSILLANLNLLFWLSLVPVVTGWMGQNDFSSDTVACYATLLILTGISYTILQFTITQHNQFSPEMVEAMRKQKRKGYISTVCYAAAIPMAYIYPLLSAGLFLLVSIMWLVPDKNIEKAYAKPQ